jgi:sigma-B regulation protein RsbU (phosphoserine phosphatase)
MTTRADAALEAFYAALLEDDATELYERAPCGYLSTLPDGRIIKVNQTFLTLTGYERDQLVGRKTFAELLTAGGRIYHETHYAPMLQMQGHARQIALDIVRADGQRLAVLVNSVLERNGDGEPVVIRTAIFDATERREYERELLRAKQRAEESEDRARLLARTLQQTLIPPAPPAVDGLEVAAIYRPAHRGDDVGGDFYDVFQLGERDWLIAVGDVTGKGVHAAVVTALVRYTLRAAAHASRGLAEILNTVNGVLLRDDTDRYCTVALLRLTLVAAGWTARVCAAGHPLPLLTRSAAAAVALGRHGSLLGAFDRPQFFEAEMVLESGDGVVLYTDGVTEGQNGGEFFGEDALRTSLTAHAGAADAMATGIVDDVMRFQGGDPRDDIVVVAVRIP